jgi:type VI secretion system lysozyme-like protein
LADDEFHLEKETRPFRYHDIEGLEFSISAELSRLLNTRRGPVPSNAETKGTVVNYGVPDNVLDSPNGVRNQEKFCQELKAAIQTFEPRLKSVDVGVIARDHKFQNVTVEISGEVELNTVKLAVRFPIVVAGEQGSLSE